MTNRNMDFHSPPLWREPHSSGSLAGTLLTTAIAFYFLDPAKRRPRQAVTPGREISPSVNLTGGC